MPSLTLAQLDGSAPITPGDGTPKPADLSQAAAAQQAAPAAAPAATSAAPETPAAAPPAKTEEETQADAAAQRLAELKAKPEAELTAEEKAELAAATPAEVVDEDPTSFWKDVDKLRGEEIVIKWEDHKNVDGTPVDPVSPEGALIREKALEARAIEKFEMHLMQTDPRSYAYILHRQRGGSDEDFFAKKTISLPEYETFKGSVDLQQKVYRESLIRKGVSEKQAKSLVDLAVKDNEILELADAAYKEYETSHAKELKDVADQIERETKQFEESVAAMSTMLTKEISSNESMKFIVPDSKKAEFNQFVRNHIREQEGKFYVAQEISKDTIGKVLEGLYLRFVNGDLNQLVQRRAQTTVTNRLRSAAAKTTSIVPGKETTTNRKKTLGEL
jgi:hypothetical protein